MITATQRCGCPTRHISLPTPEPLSKHPKSWMQSNAFDQTHRACAHQSHEHLEHSPACCCSINEKPREELRCRSPTLEKSTAPKNREKSVSEIAGTGSPYKEIEAIINNNRMVLRIQKIPIKEEWDPPCDCDTENFEEKQFSIGSQRDSRTSMTSALYGENIIFRKAEENSKPSSVHQERTVEPGGSARRTITVVSHPDSENGPPGISSLGPNSKPEDDKKEKKIDKTKVQRSIDLEENPNLFILKIRKKSETAEGRENIDLEFRTPRPWRPKPRIGKSVRKPVDKSPLPEKKIDSLQIDEEKNGNKSNGKKDKGKKEKIRKKGKR